MNITDALARVRFEIGDPPQQFRSTGVGDGEAQLYDLPKQELNEGSLQVVIVNGASMTTLVDGTDFTVDPTLGKVFLAEPVPLNATLIIAGTSWAMFSDDDIYRIFIESAHQHMYGQEIPERYRDARGFVDFRETPKYLQALPQIEEPLVVMLTVVNCFWALANDAATDSNVQTAEGTVIDRTTRYQHIMTQIQGMTARYQDYCGQLNVGLYRAETLQLRRTSKTTGRLVPIFKSQEYDDHRWPTRELPPIDHRNDDNSGVPSPLWTPNWGS